MKRGADLVNIDPEEIEQRLLTAIREQNLGDFTALLPIPLSSSLYLTLIVTALQYQAEQILSSLSAINKITKTTLQTSGSEFLLYLIGVRYASVFNRNPGMREVRQKFMTRLSLKYKTHSLSIINGQHVPLNQLQLIHGDNLTPYTVFAAANGQLGTLQYLLNGRPPIDNPILEKSVLTAAVINGAREVCIYLLDQGLSLHTEYSANEAINAAFKPPVSILTVAVAADQFDVFTLLLSRGARMTPAVYQEICYFGKERYFSYCLEHYPALFAAAEACEYLVRAIQSGNESTMKWHCERTTLLTSANAGLRAMQAALASGNVSLVRYLHEQHQLPLLTTDRIDALLQVLTSRNAMLVDYLFTRGFQPQSYTESQLCDIMIALLRYGFKTHLQDLTQKYPVDENLHLWVPVLVEAYRGLSREAGEHALFAAIAAKQLAVVITLIQLNVNLTACNSSGETALMIAVRSRRVDILTTLLQALKGMLTKEQLIALVNQKSNQNETALSLLTTDFKFRNISVIHEKSTRELAEALCDHGAKLYEEIQNRQTGTWQLIPCCEPVIPGKGEFTYNAGEKALCVLMANMLLHAPTLTPLYLPEFSRLSRLLKEMSTEFAELLTSLSRREEHLKRLMYFQQWTSNPEDPREANRLLCEAISISAEWTECGLPILVNGCWNYDTDQPCQRLHHLIRAVLALGSCQAKSRICLEIADKLFILAHSLSDNSEKKHGLLLALILFELQPEDELSRENIPNIYQQLLELENDAPYDSLSALFQSLDDEQQKTLGHLQQEKETLLQQLSSSAPELAQNNKALFAQAILRGSQQVIQEFLKNEICTVLEPLDEENHNALQLAQNAPNVVMPLLFDHIIRVYTQRAEIRLEDAAEISEIWRQLPEEIKFQQPEQCSALKARFRMVRAHQYMLNLVTVEDLKSACKFNKELVLERTQQTLRRAPESEVEVEYRNRLLLFIFQLRPSDAELLNCIVAHSSEAENSVRRAYAKLMLTTLPGAHANEFLSELCRLANVRQNIMELENIIRASPQEILTAVMKIQLFTVHLINPELTAQLTQRLEAALQLTDFVRECQSIKQCIEDTPRPMQALIRFIAKQLLELENKCQSVLLVQLADELEVERRKTLTREREDEGEWSPFLFHGDSPKRRRLEDEVPAERSPRQKQL